MIRSRLLAVMLLALLLIPTPTVRGAAPTAPTDFPAFSIVFVGSTVIDLMWDPHPDALRYRLDRETSPDDTVTPETINGGLFYRDAQATATDLKWRDALSSWEGLPKR